MRDQDFLAVLASYGASSLDQCFLIKDSRSDGYSVGMFDSNGQPRVFIEDDEAFHDAMVAFLMANDVKSYDNVADLMK
ncbi:hypothetical protein [Phenylobacterium sp.]|uniref:hypothetical protein n=1 Tax=Phenylobacterium sp. TaxID=1871053 RepID=UPI002731A7A2|nr:hypothetical protein [Phenylobacterium sp.]MDP2213143.1 hypothetical protein [Phenylobacterium sp.]